jgi:hypothetical protein
MHVVAYPRQIPVTLALIGRQRDSRAEQAPLRMAGHLPNLRRALEVREGIDQGMPRPGKDGSEQTVVAGRFDWILQLSSVGRHVAFQGTSVAARQVDAGP